MAIVKTNYLKHEDNYYEIIPPVPTESDRGGIVASTKTSIDTVEAKLGDDGKLYVPDANAAISAHNTNTSAHTDIQERLNELESNPYTLPQATGSTLGGVTIGDNVQVSNGKISVKNSNTSQPGVVQLTDSTSSTSTTTAATPNSVKKAYDLANTAKTNAVNAQTSADEAKASAVTAQTTAESGVSKANAVQAAVDAEVQRATGVENGLDTRLKAVEAQLGDGENSVSDLIATAKEEAINTAAEDATTKANNAETNAKAYTDEKDTAMNTRVEALEAVDHSHANQAELDKIAEGDKAKWDDAVAKAHEHANKTVIDGITEDKVKAWDATEQNAKTYADGLNTTMNAKVDGIDGRVTTLETTIADKADADDLDSAVARIAANETAIAANTSAINSFSAITVDEVNAYFA